MEQKKSQKDVLIVRDEKTGEIGVVAGLGKDGNPKLSPPKAENKGDFLQFNKQDNMLESFFSNFYRQTKEPHRFGFYRVATENVEQLLDVFKELLKDPEANKAMLEPHKIDTQQYQQTEQIKTAEEVAPSSEKAEQEVVEPKEEKQPYKPIDESRIDWQAMKDVYGIPRSIGRFEKDAGLREIGVGERRSAIQWRALRDGSPTLIKGDARRQYRYRTPHDA
ncbi:hypothetical protein BN938_2700 [Mucinivorans hirudinis]|uniref:DUF3945 domain-containing protein n=1 Tax=Mucinivorans hirudinis TaxID=1433126 RepID=A0A060REK7_9BACT|nr:hypothetical protein BN938_2700 [Mucinivorans hirudinis]